MDNQDIALLVKRFNEYKGGQKIISSEMITLGKLLKVKSVTSNNTLILKFGAYDSSIHSYVPFNKNLANKYAFWEIIIHLCINNYNFNDDQIKKILKCMLHGKRPLFTFDNVQVDWMMRNSVPSYLTTTMMEHINFTSNDYFNIMNKIDFSEWYMVGDILFKKRFVLDNNLINLLIRHQQFYNRISKIYQLNNENIINLIYSNSASPNELQIVMTQYNYKIPENVINDYINKKNSNAIYEKGICKHNYKNDKLFDNFIALFPHIENIKHPNIEFLKQIIDFGLRHKSSSNNINTFITTLLLHVDKNSINNEDIVMSLLFNKDVKIHNIELLINAGINKFNIDHINHYLKITTELTKYNIFNNVIPTLNIIPNEKTLTYAYINENKYIIDLLLNKYQVKPTNYCIEKYLLKKVNKNISLDYLTELLNYRCIPSIDTIKKILMEKIIQKYPFTQVMELLILYGFKLTYELLEYLLIEEIKINDLQRFDIDYDEKLYFSCHKMQSFIYDCNKINGNVLHLRKLFINNTDIDTIIAFMNENNLKPDRYCIDYLMKSRFSTFQHFTNLGYCPTQLFWLTDNKTKCTVNNLHIYNKLIQSSNIDHNYMAQMPN